MKKGVLLLLAVVVLLIVFLWVRSENPELFVMDKTERDIFETYNKSVHTGSDVYQLNSRFSKSNKYRVDIVAEDGSQLFTLQYKATDKFYSTVKKDKESGKIIVAFKMME